MKRTGHYEKRKKTDFGFMGVESGCACMGSKHACGSFDRLKVIYVHTVVRVYKYLGFGNHTNTK